MKSLAKNKIDELAEEVKVCITEGIFASRWALVEMAHKIGELIHEFEQQEDVPMSNFLPSLAKQVGRSERTLYRAAQIHATWPDKDKIPFGKNASMNKLLNEINPPKEEKCHHCSFHCPPTNNNL